MNLVNIGKHTELSHNLKRWDLRRFKRMEPEAIAILEAWRRDQFFPVAISTGGKGAIWMVDLERLTVTEEAAEDGLKTYWEQYRTIFIYRKKKFKTTIHSRKIETWRHE